MKPLVPATPMPTASGGKLLPPKRRAAQQKHARQPNHDWTGRRSHTNVGYGTSGATAAHGVVHREGPMEVTGIRRFGLICLAIVCIVLGAITLPLPLPTGLILLAIGFGLLVMSSKRVRVWFHAKRRARPWLDAKLRKVEHHLPAAVRRALTPDPTD